MTDRELLELAAKAYGFGLCADGKYALCWTDSDYPRGSKTSGALWNYIGHDDNAQLWNPLTDDGDALRLAVKLHMTCSFDESGVFVEARDGFGACTEKTDYRRAIVRAAAVG